MFENFTNNGYNLIGCYDFTKIGIFNLKKKSFSSVLEEHKDYIRSIKYLPNKNLIISGSDDDTTRIWDFDKLVPLATLTGGAEHLIITNDEEYIIRTIYDRISIVNCNDFSEIKSTRIAHDYITDITITSDKKFIFISSGKTIKILDFDTLDISSYIDTTKSKFL